MSKLFSLNIQDVVKGGFIFVVSAVLTSVLGMIQGGAIDWNTVIKIAVISTLTYILKQLGTDDSGKLGGVI